MEVYEREDSQSRPSSIKRPWEEDTGLPERGNAWHSALLQPIDAVTHCRGPNEREGDEGQNGNGPAPKESVMKKAKFEGHDYNTFPRHNLAPNVTTAPSRGLNPMHNQTRGSLESQSFTPEPRGGQPGVRPNGNEPADSHDTSNLCRRCRRLTMQSRESDAVGDPESCEDCKRNPELQWVTQETCLMLTHLAETLSSGISSEERGIVRGVDQHLRTDCPPMEAFGLKQTLNWILGRVYHINQLADQLVSQERHISAASLQNFSKDDSRNDTKAQHGPADIIKRRFDVDSDDVFKARDDADTSSDTKPHIRQRSVITSMLANDELLPLKSQPEYHPSLPSIDGAGPVQRASGMNPPPAPNRQLPSPPGRSSHPSPTSLNLPSPSTPSFGINTQGVNLPPPSSLHQQSNSNYLPPITASRSPDSALRDHSSALQHEVSVQKIALSSLQSEHDKLLAAFYRSQTRASALEKKHAVSDSEVITLTEEKLRLQAQVIELERDVEELARRRDEFRQAAVQEGAQYVEIVRRASRLEEIGREERRNWKELKEDMERTIAALKAGSSGEGQGMRPIENVRAVSRVDKLDTDTPASSEGNVPDMKMVLTSDARTSVPVPVPDVPSVQQESVDDLKAEIHRLREQCANVENALRAIRDDSRSMEGIVKTLLDRADLTLQR